MKYLIMLFTLVSLQLVKAQDTFGLKKQGWFSIHENNQEICGPIKDTDYICYDNSRKNVRFIGDHYKALSSYLKNDRINDSIILQKLKSYVMAYNRAVKEIDRLNSSYNELWDSYENNTNIAIQYSKIDKHWMLIDSATQIQLSLFQKSYQEDRNTIKCLESVITTMVVLIFFILFIYFKS